MLNPFRKKPFVLDISDFSIELLQIKKGFKGKLVLVNFGRVKLEEETIKDGNIVNRERFEEKIKDLLSNVGGKKLDTKKLILSLPESKVFFHIFTLPADIQEKNLSGAVESQAFKTIPLNPEEIYFDFQVVSKKRNYQQVLYAAAQKKVVDEYINILKGLGLEPVALDIESASLGRALQKEESLLGSTLIIDIGARKTVLIIMDKKSIRMSSVVFLAGNYFNEKIAEEMNVTPRKAEMLRRRYGVREGEKGKEVSFVLKESLSDIIKKTEKLIAFYEKRTKRNIEKILLAGGCSLMPGMDSYFSTSLGIQATVADPSLALPAVKDVLEKKARGRKSLHQKFHPVLFSNAVGLALRTLEEDPETSGLNLIPVSQRPEQPTFLTRRLNKSRVFNNFIAVFSALNLIFFWWVVYNYIYKSFWVRTWREIIPRNEKVEEEATPEKKPEKEIEQEIPLETEEEEQYVLEVLNGSGISGVAGEAADFLQDEGFNVSSIGNADNFDYEKTIIKYKKEKKETAESISQALGAGDLQEIAGQEEDILLIIGKDVDF